MGIMKLILSKQIDFAATILSRFDLIFLVKDEHNEARDRVGSPNVL